MSYNLATVDIWKKLFNINTIDDLTNTLIKWYDMVGIYHFDNNYRYLCKGYHFDQQIFYKHVHVYLDTGGKMVALNLCECSTFNEKLLSHDVINKIKNGFYDRHIFLFPWKKKEKNNLKIKKLLLEIFGNNMI